MTDNPTLQSEKLEPCPCNSAVELRLDRIEVGNWVQVVCDNCGRRGAQGGSQWMAITLWNQDRSRTPVVAPQVEQSLKKRAAQIIDTVVKSPCVVEVRFFSQPQEAEQLENQIARILADNPAATPTPVEQEQLKEIIEGAIRDLRRARTHEPKYCCPEDEAVYDRLLTRMLVERLRATPSPSLAAREAIHDKDHK